MTRKWIPNNPIIRLLAIIVASVVVVVVLFSIFTPSRNVRKSVLTKHDFWWKDAVKDGKDIFTTYESFHAEMIAKCPENCRVVLIDPGNGPIPDQMQAVASGLVLAMTTNRALVVKWPDSGLFKAPFRWDFKNLPADTVSLQIDPFVGGHPLYQPGSFNVFRNNLPRNDLNRLVCEDINLWPESVVLIKAWDYFAPMLTNNPFLGPVIDEILGRSELFTTVANHIFKHDVPDIFKGKYTIGVYISDEEVRRGIVLVSLECAISGSKIAPKPHDVLFFLTMETDSDDVKQMAADFFSKRGFDYMWSNTDTLTDLFLLGECNDIVIPEGNIFGGVAQARTRRLQPPASINKDRKCLRHMTREPCSYGWRGLQYTDCFNPVLYEHPSATDLAYCGIDIEYCRHAAVSGWTIELWHILAAAVVGASIAWFVTYKLFI